MYFLHLFENDAVAQGILNTLFQNFKLIEQYSQIYGNKFAVRTAQRTGF